MESDLNEPRPLPAALLTHSDRAAMESIQCGAAAVRPQDGVVERVHVMVRGPLPGLDTLAGSRRGPKTSSGNGKRWRSIKKQEQQTETAASPELLRPSPPGYIMCNKSQSRARDPALSAIFTVPSRTRWQELILYISLYI